MEQTRNKDNHFRITVEPLIFTVAFSLAFSESVTTNLLIRQSCRYYKGFEMDNCTGAAQIEAQRKSSHIEACKILIETLIPSVLSFFIGPWSDTHGRKILMIIPTAGYMFYFSGWSLLSLIDDLNPAFLLSSSIFIMIPGGMVCVLIGCFCYLADITEPEDRAFRMGVAELAVNSAALLGNIFSPYVYKYGFWAVFSVNALLYAINLVYVIFFVEETIEKKHVGYKNPFKKINPFDILIKKRDNYGRAIILLSIWISAVRLLSVFGETSIKYMSTIAVFNWNIDKFSVYNTICLFFVSILGFGGLWLASSILKISENIVLLFSLITRCTSGILMGWSKSVGFFYFSSLLGTFIGFIGPLVKSKLSYLVEKQEVGKMFAILLSIELTSPQIAVPLYTTIYASLVYSSPFAIYYVSASLYFTGIIALVLIMNFSRSASNKK